MIQLLFGAAILAALFYYFCVKPLYYWREQGVKQTSKVWIFGDNWSTTIGKETFLDMFVRCYNQFPDSRYHGIYQFLQPALMIKDLDLLKQITVKEFDHFMDHRSIISEELDPLWAKNLLSLTGQKWRDMRPILSPSFTSSKMRTIFVIISKCAEDFAAHFLNKDEELIEIEMKDTFTRFTNDVIASAAFGVKVDSLGEPNNEFYLMGRELTNMGKFSRRMKILGFLLIPKVMQLLKIKFITGREGRFFEELVNDTIRTREESNIIRPDMIHLLMEAKKGIHHKEENISVDTGFATAKEADIGKGHIKEITKTDITAQALIFFFAGFDSVSSLMCFMSYELALNTEVQTKLRNEIEETLAACKGGVTYEALLKMKYMDMVVSESLRKWPSLIASDRVCTKPYTIEPASPDEKPLHIKKNTLMILPIIAIHLDPKYYPDPLRFDPERFSEENKGSIDSIAYMPFGAGPRNCIGSRFGLLEIKIVFFHLLSHFEIVPTKKTTIPLKLTKKTFNLGAEGGFWLGLRRLKK